MSEQNERETTNNAAVVDSSESDKKKYRGLRRPTKVGIKAKRGPAAAKKNVPAYLAYVKDETQPQSEDKKAKTPQPPYLAYTKSDHQTPQPTYLAYIETDYQANGNEETPFSQNNNDSLSSNLNPTTSTVISVWQVQQGAATAVADPEPGAYPGGNTLDENEWQRPEETVLPDNTNPDHGLVVANPVSQHLSLDEARPVDQSLEERRKRQLASRSKRTIVCSMLLGLVVLIALAGLLVGLLAGQNKKEESTSNKNSNMEPTITLSDREAFFLDLPNQTVTAIQQSNSSAQAKALQWVTNDPAFAAYPKWRQKQRFALATFFYSLGGFKWIFNKNWMDYSEHECEWYSDSSLVRVLPAEATAYGLKESFPDIDAGLCDLGNSSSSDQGQVERLILPTNNLKGSIPMEISMLTSLRHVAFTSNPIGGSIPTQIGRLTRLEFFAAALVKLGGTIPSEIGMAKNLTHFLIFRTEVSGTIPHQIGALTGMKGLMLDESKISGTIPTELGSLSSAIWMSSYHTSESPYTQRLTGPIPSQVGRMSSLRFLGLFGTTWVQVVYQLSWACSQI